MMYKFCRCGKKIEYSLKMCKECADKRKANSRGYKDRYKRYSRTRLDKDIQAFYNTSAWIGVRNKVRIRDNGICKLCWDKGTFKLAEVVHHVKEVKEDFNLKLEINNLICLCNCCHKKVHKEYVKDKDSKDTMQKKLKSLIKE